MDKVLDSALLSSANKRKGILAIGAHPDDIELGCGASLARLAQKGIYIAAVVMTTGNSGTDGIIDRHEESRNALKILGCHQTIHLNFADTRAHLQLNDMISALEDIIKNQIPSD
ncbi:PIG-L family deacetylase, partial [Escherichia coli H10]|nr:PIG-L family deacetylase [Escherichia coli]EFU2720749.1 PIG-L family deacetylase [Escherichia coli]EJK5714953.1 PIG-L family deacetylase [Escherichia coli]MCV5525265.1 PIG-L family deacetylase [Escherichia coli]HAM8914187.1 PIG-L family deacetylase [Escherichia coli]